MNEPPHARTLSGYALVALAACGWGTWPLILRSAEKIAPIPASAQSVVLMVVLTAVSGVLALRDRVRVRAPLRDWAVVAWVGVADALNVVLFFSAYQTTTVAIAVLTHYLTPIFVALAAPILLREKARARTFAAVAVAFLGLVLLLRPWQVQAGSRDWLGAALGAGSAVFYASNVIANKRVVATFSGSELMFFHGFVAVPLLAALVLTSSWAHLDARAVGVVALGSVGPGALGGLCFVWGLRRVQASHASVLTLLEPLVAVVLAALFLGEILPASAVAGGALILAGAFAVVSGTQASKTSRVAGTRGD